MSLNECASSTAPIVLLVLARPEVRPERADALLELLAEDHLARAHRGGAARRAQLRPVRLVLAYLHEIQGNKGRYREVMQGDHTGRYREIASC